MGACAEKGPSIALQRKGSLHVLISDGSSCSSQSERNPVSLEDFAIRHGIEQLIHDEQLREAFKSNDRVIHNERNNTWLWQPDYDVRTPQDLLNLVEKRYFSAYPPQRHGFRLADLRDSYPQTREAVDTYSKRAKRRTDADRDGVETNATAPGAAEDEAKKLLILPGPKEGTIRQVFFNEASSRKYIAQNDGKIIQPLNEEFKDLWHSLAVPDSVDLPRQLEQEGHMTATVTNNDAVLAAQQAAAARARGRGRGRGRGGSARKVRIQNTHLEGVDLSSNYKG